MTDEQMLLETSSRLESFADKAKRITTGNLTHEIAGLRGLLLTQSFIIKKHLEQ